MERSVSERSVLDKFAIEFCEIVEKHCKYIVVSGFVAISHGRTRGTEDIDMIIEEIDLDEFSELHKELLRNGFVCMQSESPEEIFNEYLRNKLNVRYTWKDKPLPEMEVKFAKDLLDNYQIKTRTKLPLSGLDIWFSSIEMNIAFKEELLKSDKDLEDAKHLRIIYSEEIDENEIDHIKKKIRELRLNER